MARRNGRQLIRIEIERHISRPGRRRRPHDDGVRMRPSLASCWYSRTICTSVWAFSPCPMARFNATADVPAPRTVQGDRNTPGRSETLTRSHQEIDAVRPRKPPLVRVFEQRRDPEFDAELVEVDVAALRDRLR